MRRFSSNLLVKSSFAKRKSLRPRDTAQPFGDPRSVWAALGEAFARFPKSIAQASHPTLLSLRVIHGAEAPRIDKETDIFGVLVIGVSWLCSDS